MGRSVVALGAVGAVAAAPALRIWPIVARVDHVVLSALVRLRPGWMRRPAAFVTEAASPPVVFAAVGIGTVYALGQGVAVSTVARAVATSAGGIAARRLLAEAVRRDRPPAEWWWATPSGFSYPSRHVTWAWLGFGTVADLLVEADAPCTAHAMRAAAVILVAGTRLLLAVHWPTDVAAGAAFGAAWRALAASRISGQPAGSRGVS